MSMEEDLRAFLLADPAIEAAVSDIHPMVLPQYPIYPAMTWNRISVLAGYHMAGNDGLRTARMQYTSWAGTWLECKGLSDLVRERIDAIRQTLTGGTVIQGIFIDSEQDLHQAITDSHDDIWGIAQDFLVWHELK